MVGGACTVIQGHEIFQPTDETSQIWFPGWSKESRKTLPVKVNRPFLIRLNLDISSSQGKFVRDKRGFKLHVSRVIQDRCVFLPNSSQA